MNTYQLTELDRRLGNLIQIGVILDVDHTTHKLRVEIGELQTDWLPWPATIGRNFVAWRPLKPGIQVLLACPDGDPLLAVPLLFLYTDDISPASDDENVDQVLFEDGTSISYDSSTKVLNVNCAGDVQVNTEGNTSIATAGDLDIRAQGRLKLTASGIDIDGPVTQLNGDMTSDGISVQTHNHEKVKAGTDMSGGPK